MKKLEENKTIIGYSAIIDPGKINHKYYILLFKRTSLPLTETIKKNLSRGIFTDILPEIDIKLIDVMYVHGYYDFIINFTTDDIAKAKELSNKILEFYNEYLEKVELLEMVMPFRLDRIRILQPEEKSKYL